MAIYQHKSLCNAKSYVLHEFGHNNKIVTRGSSARATFPDAGCNRPEKRNTTLSPTFARGKSLAMIVVIYDDFVIYVGNDWNHCIAVMKNLLDLIRVFIQTSTG